MNIWEFVLAQSAQLAQMIEQIALLGSCAEMVLLIFTSILAINVTLSRWI